MNFLEGQESEILMAISPILIFGGMAVTLIIICYILFGRLNKLFINFTIIIAILLAGYLSFGPMQLGTIFVH